MSVLNCRSLQVVVSIATIASVCFGQASTGVVFGNITDPSGAVLPGVEIKLLNLSTNQNRSTVSNERGEYNFATVPIGSYSVTASLPGFKSGVRSRIELQVDQRARIDFAMEVGEVTEHITVTEQAPLVQATSASLGSVVDNQKIQELPLNSRDFQKLALLVPGASPSQSGGSNAFRGGMILAGTHERSNHYTFDGISLTSGNVFTYSYKPSVDEIQEFKVQPNSFDAEAGRGEGGQIIVTSKSGSNAFHGGLFEFIRNDKLDAHNFFDAPGAAKPPLKRSQFGGNLGGRIFKDRTFFFINYEGLRRREAETRTATVPTEAMHRGDFSALSARIRDPQTGLPFPGNVIPANRIHPLGAVMMTLYPLPNSPGTTRNYTSSPKTTEDNNQYTARLDHSFSAKDTAFARYSRYNNHWVDAFNIYSGISNLPYPRDDVQHNHAATISHTHIFTANVINTARAGLSRLRQGREASGAPNYREVQAALPIPGIFNRDDRLKGYPPIRPTGVDPIGYSPLENRSDMHYQYVDTLSWNKGSHSMKFGVDYARQQIFRLGAGTEVGDYRFSGIYTGNGVADMLLGIPNSAGRTLGDSKGYYFENQTMFFFQDDWRVTSRLTLNLGARYENESVWWEKFGRMANYDPNTRTIEITGTAIPKREYLRSDTQDASLAAISASLKFADLNTKYLYPGDPNNIAPRIGFAWDAFGASKMIVRGGAGVFFANRPNDWGLGVGNFPFRTSETFNNVQPNAATGITPGSAFTLSAPFGGVAASVVNIAARAKDFKLGYVTKYSLGIQWQFLSNTVLDLDYMGSLSRHLYTSFNINQPPPGPTSIASRRPFPVLGSITLTDSSATSSYNSLRTRVERRFSDGLTFINAYTWSKVIDTSSAVGGGDGEAGYQSPYDRKSYRVPAAFDKYAPGGILDCLCVAGRKRAAMVAQRVRGGRGGPWRLAIIEHLHLPVRQSFDSGSLGRYCKHRRHGTSESNCRRQPPRQRADDRSLLRHHRIRQSCAVYLRKFRTRHSSRSQPGEHRLLADETL